MAEVERRTTFEADPASVRAARRFVAEALADADRTDHIDTVELLVSELVTNAVLHARSRVELLVRVEDDLLRVEVGDTSPVLPATRAHDRESQTGRGLELVEMMSLRWGFEVDHSQARRQGKSVWFELELEPGGRVTPGSHHGHGIDPPPVSGLAPSSVCLEGVPLKLFRTSQEHRDGLIREFLLMTLDRSAATGTPARLVALSEELAVRFAGESAMLHAQVDEAEQRGDETVDLLLLLPPEAFDALVEVVDLLEEADRYCGEGALLTLAASEEVRAFRRWCLHQIADQLGGQPPRRWRDP